MDVIHYHLQIISRAKGRCAASAAAYRAGEKLYNERNGVTYDFTRKNEVVHRRILLPDHAPREFADRTILWNAVEEIEKADNARMAREFKVYLYSELELPEQIHLIENYVQETYVNQGMCADICIHDKGDANPHAHVMLTTRSMKENGEWLPKQRKNYILDKDGGKIYDPVKKQYRCGRSIKTNDWDKEGNVMRWREAWAQACNREFERKGLEKRVTHESYAARGIELEPTKHLGPKVLALKQRGIQTDHSLDHDVIEAKNREHMERYRRQLREFEYEQNRDYER